MSELLKCVLCRGPTILTYVLNLCEKDHLVCDECKLDNVYCPKCYGEIITTRQLYSGGMIECPNSLYGCQSMVFYEDLKTHRSDCAFQRILCPFSIRNGNCAWRHPYTDLKAHIMSAHGDFNYQIEAPGKNTFTLRNPRTFKVSKGTVMTMDETFLIYMELKDRLICAIIYLGPTTQAGSFNYRLKFVTSNRREYIETSHVCRSFDEAFVEHKDFVFYSVVPWVFLKKCMDENGDIKIEFEIGTV